ncbi:MAG TPA: 16S rRNA (cytosine(967)-C(5))-methyltransferase [Gammaproteobacteria bacterium]|nr:16S rRNA (cytosine(967)-C(5))-methyltransferase [Gammaproteobacteria bacterium]
MTAVAVTAFPAPALARAAAARVVAAVLFERRSLATALPRELAQLHAAQSRAAAQDLAYNTLRFAQRTRLLLPRLLERPLKRRDGLLEALLLVGLTQLLELGTPAHAAVASTVEAAGLIERDWARGLCNAVLRRADRERAALQQSLLLDPVARHAHPGWFIDALETAWGADAADRILAAGNRPPPMTLRVNQRLATRERVAAELAEAGFATSPCRWADAGLRLVEPVDIAALPGFADGRISVQDEAAQLAAVLLDPRPGQRVLDACAAPGGKTAQIAEREAALAQLVAVEVDPRRTRLIDDTLRRLRLPASVVTADAAAVASWWDGRPFDRILLDAPCSGTGVIRRHPDIKHLREPADIPRLAEQQARLLDALWPLLAPGGQLVFVTCSVLPAEGDAVVADFLSRQAAARVLPVAADWGLPTRHGRQLLPGNPDDTDGFFHACLAHA